jgi:hypothetical protein
VRACRRSCRLLPRRAPVLCEREQRRNRSRQHSGSQQQGPRGCCAILARRRRVGRDRGTTGPRPTAAGTGWGWQLADSVAVAGRTTQDGRSRRCPSVWSGRNANCNCGLRPCLVPKRAKNFCIVTITSNLWTYVWSIKCR